MPWSFIYLTIGRILQLVLLCLRRRDSNEVEILVLRHELDILRRQNAHPSAGAKGPCLVGAAQSDPAAGALVGLRGHPRHPGRLAPPDGAPALDLPNDAHWATADL